MSDQLKGNPHAENYRRSVSEFGHETIAAEGLTDATIIWQGLVHLGDAAMVEAFESRTANLLGLYKSSLFDRLNDAERLEVENEILERTGVRDV